MDPIQLEKIFDEVVWQLMETLNSKEVESGDAMKIMDGIARLAGTEKFEDEYFYFNYEQSNDRFKEYITDEFNLHDEDENES